MAIGPSDCVPIASRPAHKAAPQDAPRPVPSLVPVPAVVAHRGAAGYRPEHTLEAYRAGIRMGADDIEVDLVMTRDGVLVARHENELSATTDVAQRPEFADRRRTAVIDGATKDGWFSEDFTFAEIKTLSARERFPRLRPGSALWDGREAIASLTEVLAMAQAESLRVGRQIGVLLELKHVDHFESLGLDVVSSMLGVLQRHELLSPTARITVMSFETAVLRRLATLCRLPLVQLLGHPREQPPDFMASGDPRTCADLVTEAGLQWIDEYADGIGVAKILVLPRDRDGHVGEPTTLVSDAHRLGLTVHVWTLRAENSFLARNFRSSEIAAEHGDLAAETRAFVAVGVDGLITDQPDIVVDCLTAAHPSPVIGLRGR